MKNKTTTILSLTALSVLSTLVLATATITISMQPVLASSGASQFAPGHEAQAQGSEGAGASLFAPGHQTGRLPGGGCDTPSFAPGHLFKQQPTS